MCSRAAVESLECYLEDLVDNFEDFVKKSLIFISIAVATIVAMLVYALKVILDHVQTSANSEHSTSGMPALIPAETDPVSNNTFTPQSPRYEDQKTNTISYNESLVSDCLSSFKNKAYAVKREQSKSTCTSTDCSQLTQKGNLPSFDEQLLAEIGLTTSSKNCATSDRRLVDSNRSAPRQTIPSKPTCVTKSHLSSSRPCTRNITNKKSCCSVCCDYDCRS